MTTLSIDFIGIGAPKCGTSWLSKQLSDHPDVCLATDKETRFFTKHYPNGFEWYARQFPECEGKLIRGEFTPEYMTSEIALARIAESYPDAKLLVNLRNPIDRLRSSWAFDYGRGAHNETSFEKFLKNEPYTTQKKRGFYGEQLGAALKYFRRDQFFILLFEDIKENPDKVRNNLYNFLGLDPDRWNPVHMAPQNVSSDKKLRSRRLGNVMFAARRAREASPALERMSAMLHKTGLASAVKMLDRFNRSGGQRTETLDSTISEELRAELTAMYAPDVARLRREWDLTLPESWRYPD